MTAPSRSGYRCPGTTAHPARVERANSQPGLLQILLIHQPGRRGDLCLWHDESGQGELPAGEERRSEPQGSSAGCILSKSRCKSHPLHDRLLSPQHPPFPGSAQAVGLCHIDGTQKHPGGRWGHPQRPPGPAPDARRDRAAGRAAQELCGLLPPPAHPHSAPQHPLPLGTGEAQEGAPGGLEDAGKADEGGAANRWSLENPAALSSPALWAARGIRARGSRALPLQGVLSAAPRGPNLPQDNQRAPIPHQLGGTRGGSGRQLKRV